MTEASIFISAGDKSGDNAAARLLNSIKREHNNIECFGLGGSRLKESGQLQITDFEKINVIGFWEVFKKYFFFRKLFKTTIEKIKISKPSVIILVDYPGFNLRLARKVKPLGIPIIYYITPQVWAWGKERLNQIEKTIDLVIPILPFEKEIFDEKEIRCEYVGHYLLEDLPEEYIASPPPDDGYLALLPGSRPQEVQRMIKPMIEAARIINKKYGMKAKIAGVKGCFDYESHLSDDVSSFIEIVYDNSRKVVYESKIVVTASGTATLETGIIGRPMVIIYKTSYLTYQIARNLIKLDMIGLVNLVLNEKVVPELIQHDASSEKIADEIIQILDDSEKCQKVIRKLNGLVTVLGERSASNKAAELILGFIK